MAEEKLQLSGIDWQETFSFTHVFRSFRLAIHPSKLVLAFVGLLVSCDRWRRLWPTYAVFAAVTLFHALVITSVRFRIPLEPFSFVWAAWAIVPLGARLAPRRGIRVYHPGERRETRIDPAHGLRGPHGPGRTRRQAA